MSSLLKVGRFILKPDWTIGKLYINNVLDGYTVEDEIRDQAKKVYGETAIPYGTYPLTTRISPKFTNSFLYSEAHNLLIESKELESYRTIKDWKPHELIWIKNIPGFEYVLLHWGNTDDDTDGCLVVGKAMGVISGQEGVVQSKIYYKTLYPKIIRQIKAGSQFIEYVKE